jgi:large subunit ribosomal protein L4
MKRIAVIKEDGAKAGQIALPESFFEAKVSAGAVYYSVNALLNNQRQGNASTKDRSQVNYSGRKPWRQKGTGRARAGTRKSPLWRGGGTTFGPKAKDYGVQVPKKIRRAAFRSALSAKANEEGAIVVVENLEFSEPSTKRIDELIRSANASDTRVLIMSDGYKPLLWKSVRNIPGAEIKPFTECNAYDVMLAGKLIIEKSVIEKLEQKPNEGSVSDSETAPVDREK